MDSLGGYASSSEDEEPSSSSRGISRYAKILKEASEKQPQLPSRPQEEVKIPSAVPLTASSERFNHYLNESTKGRSEINVDEGGYRGEVDSIINNSNSNEKDINESGSISIENNLNSEGKAKSVKESSKHKNRNVDESAASVAGGADVGGDGGSASMVIPVSHQLDLVGHTKAVTCFSVDQPGNRVVSGSNDYNVKIYDFGGMDSRGEAFRTFEPCEGHPVTSIAHSLNGDRFIVGTKSWQPRVYSRDAQLIITFVRGDSYIRDLANTKGHTNEVTCVVWHPTLPDYVVTASLDGSVRIWDLKGEALFGNLINKHVLKIRSSADGKRVGARCCTVASSGQLIVGGAIDGSLHFWLEKKAYARTADFVVNAAHGGGKSAVQSVLLNSDASLLYSRGEDSTIKIWNIKKLSAITCLKTYTDAPSIYIESNMHLSPDEAVLVCGTSSYGASSTDTSSLASSNINSSSSSSSSSSSYSEEKKTKSVRIIQSNLSFFDAKRFDTESSSDRVAQIALQDNASIIFVKWVQSTNQIACSLSNGTIRMFYDPSVSKKGAMLSAAKKVSRKDLGMTAADYGVTGKILTPHALPLFRKEQPHNKRKKEIEIRDSLVPSKPNALGPGSAVNTSFFFTQYVMEGKKKSDDLKRDPRQALLEIDEKARSDPLFFGRAYQASQPTPVLDDKTLEQETQDFIKRQRSFEDRDK